MNQQLILPGKRNKKIFWSLAQEKIVYSEISRNILNYSNQFNRKSKKIFVKMAKRFRNKTPQQCRNHCKNILKEFKSIQEYIQCYKQKFQDLKQNKQDSQDIVHRMDQNNQIEIEQSSYLMGIDQMGSSSREQNFNTIQRNFQSVHVYGLLEQFSNSFSEFQIYQSEIGNDL